MSPSGRPPVEKDRSSAAVAWDFPSPEDCSSPWARSWSWRRNRTGGPGSSSPSTSLRSPTSKNSTARSPLTLHPLPVRSGPAGTRGEPSFRAGRIVANKPQSSLPGTILTCRDLGLRFPQPQVRKEFTRRGGPTSHLRTGLAMASCQRVFVRDEWFPERTTETH